MVTLLEKGGDIDPYRALLTLLFMISKLFENI